MFRVIQRHALQKSNIELCMGYVHPYLATSLPDHTVDEQIAKPEKRGT